MTTRAYANALVVTIATLIACDNFKNDANYCPGRLNDDCREAPGSCGDDRGCSGDKPVCAVDINMCVQCTSSSTCSGPTPICGDDNACRGCEEHSECPESLACSPDGCADADMVAYVAPGGGGTSAAGCQKDSPCPTLADAAMTMKPYIKIAAGMFESNQTTVIQRAVTILADPGAKLDRNNDGVILEIRGSNADVKIIDLEISGASGGAGDVGISIPAGGTPRLTLTRVRLTNNQGGGISATGGTLTISQSTVANNQGGGISATGGTLTISASTLSGNAGGGISVANGTFVIVGNVLYNNGTQDGVIGGIVISTLQNATNRLEFNSFNKNQRRVGEGAALDCDAGIFTARNNIMSENGTLMNMEQVSGPCAHEYSIVRPGMLPAGAENSNMDPLFQDPENGDLHLRSGSPAIDAADLDSILTGPAERDIDRQVRTRPADIGADEVP